MQKNTLTQKKIDKLDKIAKKCGLELHMPPFKKIGNYHYPFFVLKEKDNMDDLIVGLATSKFIYGITRMDKKRYILIKG